METKSKTLNREGEILRKAIRRSDYRQEDFAKLMGFTTKRLSDIMREGLSDYHKEKSAEILGKTVEELYGELPTVNEPIENYVTLKKNKGIPVYDTVAIAGAGDTETQLKGNIIRRIILPGFEDCIGIPAYGQSMYPRIWSGAVCLCRPQPDKSHIIYGQIYFIVYKGNQYFKFLHKIKDDDSKLLCVSLNHQPNSVEFNFAPFEINRDEIDALYLMRLPLNLEI